MFVLFWCVCFVSLIAGIARLLPFALSGFMCLVCCCLIHVSHSAVLICFLRYRIYEATGGKGLEVCRQIGHHHTVELKEPQEATGVQILAQEATKGKIPAWETPNPT